MNFQTKYHRLIKHFLFVLTTFSIYLIAFRVSAQQPATTLSLSPKQCVALHQGKLCYVDIKISWSAQVHDNYCLFSSQQNEPIKCWAEQNKGEFKREIVANENVQFHLKQRASDVILQSVELEMKWVYKKNSKPRSYWRVF